MKVSEVLKALKDDGWFQVAQKGSHRQFKHPSKPGRVTIAGKPSDELARGIQIEYAKARRSSRFRTAMKYAVVIEKAGENFSAYVPDLPGCIATGDTASEVEQQIREAISFHLDGLREDGIEIPEPSCAVGYVELAA